MSNIAFTPNKFEPVIEVAQKATSQPIGFNLDFDGFGEFAEHVVHVSNASARGYGSSINEVMTATQIGEVFRTLFSARLAAEVLKFEGVHTKFTSALCNSSPPVLEPLVKAYGYYGHFERDGKSYAPRDAEGLLVRSLIKLCHLCHPNRVNNLHNHVSGTGAQYNAIDGDYFCLDDAGQVIYTDRQPLEDYVLTVVNDVLAQGALSTSQQLALVREATQIASESGLYAFRRYALTQGYPAMPNRNTHPAPPAALNTGLNAVLGQQITLVNGTALPNAVLLAAISRGYQILRRISTERQYVMKTMSFPKYEGGTPAQLASYVDDVLFSDTPLSLSDSTGAVALGFNNCTVRNFASHPGLDKQDLARQIAQKSIILK
jgi:hypothetical protein